MTFTLKPKTEITVPRSIRRQAGIKVGDRIEFSVSRGVITIRPKLSPDDVQDKREIRDPKVRAAIKASHAEFVAGKSRPTTEFLASRTQHVGMV
jgi:bifunctional DNA-binding transcriptional regulator/antitoxin component of YhaV-PrlF toxin-antitoxin module